jgi:hypothetical protein
VAAVGTALLARQHIMSVPHRVDTEISLPDRFGSSGTRGRKLCACLLGAAEVRGHGAKRPD